jgi:uncharacterized membrane protein YkoI
MDKRAALFSIVAAAGLGAALWLGLSRLDPGGQVNQPSERQAHEAHEAREAEDGSEALERSDHDRVRRLKQQGAILSLQELLESARRYHEGRVLETEVEHRDGRYVYEIEVLDEHGRVWEMKLDAASGELLEEAQE